MKLCRVTGLDCHVAPVCTTTCLILSSNKIQNGDILVLAYPASPGQWTTASK